MILLDVDRKHQEAYSCSRPIEPGTAARLGAGAKRSRCGFSTALSTAGAIAMVGDPGKMVAVEDVRARSGETNRAATFIAGNGHEGGRSDAGPFCDDRPGTGPLFLGRASQARGRASARRASPPSCGPPGSSLQRLPVTTVGGTSSARQIIAAAVRQAAGRNAEADQRPPRSGPRARPCSGNVLEHAIPEIDALVELRVSRQQVCAERAAPNDGACWHAPSRTRDARRPPQQLGKQEQPLPRSAGASSASSSSSGKTSPRGLAPHSRSPPSPAA